MASKRFYLLSVHDLEQAFWVFCKSPRKNVYPELRPEYHHLRCEACKRFDPWDAIQQVGLPDDVVPPIRRDAMLSEDDQLVVSKRSKQVVESVPGADAHFFQLPAAPDFFLMYPKRTFEAPPGTLASDELRAPPDKDNPFALTDDRCELCGRQATRFWTQYCRVPEDMVLGAARQVGEENLAAMFWWIGSREVADALRKAQLSGWNVGANEFLN